MAAHNTAVLEFPRFLRIESPYPGLRTFEPDEAFLFFGREEHTRELLTRLAASRFLAVVGTSGSGKSSLVRAGLVPSLHRGFLDRATSRWKIAIMRPGRAPMANLSAKLSEALWTQALGAGALLPVLNASSSGIMNAVNAAKLDDNENLLLVVDQFEELFRFQRDQPADGRAEGQLFVASLLEAAGAFSPRVYVVLTMRSEFLGDCTQFPGLPEALNQSQYLIPRLTREQCREAIEKPLAVAGATAEPALVQRLLFDLGEDSDQLPVLQHALNRTFQQWKNDGGRGHVLIRHYEKAGTLDRALNDHADALLPKDLAGVAVVAHVFRCLTTIDHGKEVRNPASLERIFAVTGSGEAAVRDVIGRFAAKENSLLVFSPPGELKPETVVDISHESLIRKWDKLKGWVAAEAESVRWYSDATEDAWRHPAKTKTWRDPKLAFALVFISDGWWNASWADWVLKEARVPYPRVLDFLNLGSTEQQAEDTRRRLQRYALIAVLALATVFASVAAWSYRQNVQTREALDVKTKSEDDARKLVVKIQASADENARKQRELEEKLSKSGHSAEETKRLNDELAKLKDQGTSVEQQKRDAEARLKAEADARKVLQNQAGVTENALAAALKRADDLDVQLKVAKAAGDTLRAENEKLKAQPPVVKEVVKEVIVEVPAPAQTPSAAPNPGDRRLNPKDGLQYRWIPPTGPAGFLMGCSSGEKGCVADEKPLHGVILTNGFWMGETEVTQAAYKKVMRGSAPSHFKGDDLPVESVTWTEADAYCKAAGMRLPTEAEWEYAARAGSPGATYGALDRIAWYSSNSKATTHSVGAKDANGWGLKDTLGNVWEWVADWYGPYRDATLTNPRGPETGTYRVVRGGGWSNFPRNVRASDRGNYDPGLRLSNSGLRCAGEFR